MPLVHGKVTITTVCGAIVLFKAIESISLRNEADSIADALGGDFMFNIITSSGKEYRVSVCNLMKRWNIDSTHAVSDVAQAVIDEWIRINN